MSASISTKRKSIGGEFLKKAASHISGASLDYISEVMPVTSSTLSEAKHTVSSVSSSFINTSQSIFPKVRQLKMQLGFKNIANWFMERENAFDGLGGSDAELSFDIDTDSSEISESPISEIGKNANQISQAVVESSHKLVESQIAATANLLQASNQQTAVITAGFDKTNETLNKILEVLTKNTSTMIETMVADKTTAEVNDDMVASGKFNLSSYKKMVAGNLKNSEVGMLASMASMLTGGGTLKQLLGPQSVIQMLLGFGIDKKFPNFKKNAAALDKAVSDTLMTSLIRLGENTDYGFKGQLARIFGIDSSRKDVDTSRSSLELKAVPFDSIAHESITNAIPGYLRKILVAVGGEDVVYDYRSRRFKTQKAIHKEFQNAMVNTNTIYNSSKQVRNAIGDDDFSSMLFDMMMTELGSRTQNGSARATVSRFTDTEETAKYLKDVVLAGMDLSQQDIEAVKKMASKLGKASSGMGAIDIMNQVGMNNVTRSMRGQQYANTADKYQVDLSEFVDSVDNNLKTIASKYGRTIKEKEQDTSTVSASGFKKNLRGVNYTNMALYEIYQKLNEGINVFQVGHKNLRHKPFPARGSEYLPPPDDYTPKRKGDHVEGAPVSNSSSLHGDTSGDQDDANLLQNQEQPDGTTENLSKGQRFLRWGKHRGSALANAMFHGGPEDVVDAFKSIVKDVDQVISTGMKKMFMGDGKASVDPKTGNVKMGGIFGKINDSFGDVAGFLRFKFMGGKWTDEHGHMQKGEGYLGKISSSISDFFNGNKKQKSPSLLGLFSGESSLDPKEDTKRKKIAGAATGALIAQLGFLGGPIGMIVGGLAGSALSVSGIGTKLSKFLLGEVGEDGKKTGNILNRFGKFFGKMMGYTDDMSEADKKGRKRSQFLGGLGGILAGSGLGLIGGPIGMIAFGLGGAALSTSGLGTKITDLVLGKKGTSGKRYGGLVSAISKAGKFIATPFRWLGTGLMTAFKAGKKVIIDPILNIGKGFKYFLFGNKETGNPGLVQEVFKNTIGVAFTEAKTVISNTMSFITHKITDPISDLLFVMRKKLTYGISDFFMGRKGKDGKRSGGIFSGFANYMTKAGADFKKGFGSVLKTIFASPFALLRILIPGAQDKDGNKQSIWSKEGRSNILGSFAGVGNAFKTGGIAAGLSNLSETVSSVGRNSDRRSANFGADGIASSDDRLQVDLEQRRLARYDRRRDTAPGTIQEHFGQLVEISEEEAKRNQQAHDEQMQVQQDIVEHQHELYLLHKPAFDKMVTPGSIYTHDIHIEERLDKLLGTMSSKDGSTSIAPSTNNISLPKISGISSKDEKSRKKSENEAFGNSLVGAAVTAADEGGLDKDDASGLEKIVRGSQTGESKESMFSKFKDIVKSNVGKSEVRKETEGEEKESFLSKMVGGIGKVLMDNWPLILGGLTLLSENFRSFLGETIENLAPVLSEALGGVVNAIFDKDKDGKVTVGEAAGVATDVSQAVVSGTAPLVKWGASLLPKLGGRDIVNPETANIGSVMNTAVQGGRITNGLYKLAGATKSASRITNVKNLAKGLIKAPGAAINGLKEAGKSASAIKNLGFVNAAKQANQAKQAATAAAAANKAPSLAGKIGSRIKGFAGNVGKAFANTKVGQKLASTTAGKVAGKAVSTVASAGAKAVGPIMKGLKFIVKHLGTILSFLVDGILLLIQGHEVYGKDKETLTLTDNLNLLFSGAIAGGGAGLGDGFQWTDLVDIIGQAIKWGALGAAVGSVVPVLGNALGAVIGVIVGIIAGCVGGKTLARKIAGVSESMEQDGGLEPPQPANGSGRGGPRGRGFLEWIGDAASATWEGAKWVGGKVVDGAVWTGGKIVDGVVWTGEKIVDGAVWAGERIVDGVKFIGSIAAAAWDGIKNIGKAIADTVGGLIGKALEIFNLIKNYRLDSGVDGLVELLMKIANTIVGSGGGQVVMPGGIRRGFGELDFQSASIAGEGSGNPYFQGSYGSMYHMNDSGCGPIAAAVMANSYGANISPINAARMMNRDVYRDSSGATTTAGVEMVGRSMGVPLKSGMLGPQDVVSRLANGEPITFLGRSNSSTSPYTKTGHFVVGSGLDENGMVTTIDPLSNQPTKYPLQSFMSGVDGMVYDGRGRGPDDSTRNKHLANKGILRGTVEASKSVVKSGINALADMASGVSDWFKGKQSDWKKANQSPKTWMAKMLDKLFGYVTSGVKDLVSGAEEYMTVKGEWNKEGSKSIKDWFAEKTKGIWDWVLGDILDIANPDNQEKVRNEYSTSVNSKFLSFGLTGSHWWNPFKRGFGIGGAASAPHSATESAPPPAELSNEDQKLPSPFIGSNFGFSVPSAASECDYGPRNLDGYHTGIDITPTSGDWTVGAVKSGVVTGVYKNAKNKDNNGYGNYVEYKDANGITYLNGHLAPNSIPDEIEPGTPVSPGDVIGTMGTTGFSTGPHLHFETRDPSVTDQKGGHSFDPAPLFGMATTSDTGRFSPGSSSGYSGVSGYDSYSGTSSDSGSSASGPLGKLVELIKNAGTAFLSAVTGGLLGNSSNKSNSSDGYTSRISDNYNHNYFSSDGSCSSVEEFLEIPRKEIGVTENPKDSNKTKYGEWYQMNGVPWCMIFVQWCFSQAGLPLEFRSASCVETLDWWQENHPDKVTGQPKPGDIMIQVKSGGKGHTGIVERVNGNSVTTIEGNTSPTDAGSQDNGGCVARKERKLSDIRKFIRPVDFEALSEQAKIAKSGTIPSDIGEGAEVLWKYFKSLGFTDEAVAGILGCWTEESGNKARTIESDYLQGFPGYDKLINDRQAMNEYTSRVVLKGKKNKWYYGNDGNLYPGIGLAQWTGTRGESLLNYAKKHNVDWGTTETQLGFLDEEFAGDYKRVPDHIQGAKTPEEAAGIWCSEFEGYNVPSGQVTRKQNARALMNLYGGKYQSGGGVGGGRIALPPGIKIVGQKYVNTKTGDYADMPIGIGGKSAIGSVSYKSSRPRQSNRGIGGNLSIPTTSRINHKLQALSTDDTTLFQSNEMSSNGTGDMSKIIMLMSQIIQELASINNNTGASTDLLGSLNEKDFVDKGLRDTLTAVSKSSKSNYTSRHMPTSSNNVRAVSAIARP